MKQSVFRYSFLLEQLVKRNFSTKYRQSILGVLWSFLNPLLTMAVQYLVFSTLFQSEIAYFPVYLLTGVILFGFCVLFQLVTLPVEFNASRRALSVLREDAILSANEMDGAKKVLRAAAMTYVASLAGTLLQLLRLISVVNNSRRR